VVRPGGPLLAASYAADDSHPVKQAVQGALSDAGWSPPPWYVHLLREVSPTLATVESCRAVIDEVGFDGSVHALRIPFPDLAPDDLVGWRLGMAQHAPFFDALPEATRMTVVRDALDRLGPSTTPLVRSILTIAGVKR
jgi:hypothetical protein